MPQLSQFPSQDHEDIKRQILKWYSEGICFISSMDLGLTELIVKVNGGLSMFGRQKANYACFFGEAETYASQLTTRQLSGALYLMGKVYIAADQIVKKTDKFFG